MRKTEPNIEWLTLGLILGVFVVWGVATTVLAAWSLTAALVTLALATALYSSLQHEVIHGHPTRHQWFNDALVFPALTIFVPYLRFRDDHLAHHKDETLTDPYDDPETNYLDPTVWQNQCRLAKALHDFNNRLLGRLTIGVAIGQFKFMCSDWAKARAGQSHIKTAWIAHLAGLLPIVAWFVWIAEMPVWALIAGTYAGLSIVKIRTFLEHQAHHRARARTVVIEDRGLLAFLFLNNNFHVVHHMHPRVSWHRLPALYHANKDHYLRRNEGYRFSSYAEVFRQFFWRAKDPVAHPLMQKR